MTLKSSNNNPFGNPVPHTELDLINRLIKISSEGQIYKKKSFSFIFVPIVMRFYPKMTLYAHIGHQRSIT